MFNPLAFLLSDDFRQSLKAKLARGSALRSDSVDTPVKEAFWGAVADAFASFHADVAMISETEADPRLATLLLPDWEACFGLPDPCTPQPQSTVDRRTALLEKITEQGDQSPAYFIGRAAAIGDTITITEFQPFRVGISSVGQALSNGPWQFTWRVNGPLSGPVSFFRVGLSAVGDPLSSFGNAELQCVLDGIAPAHTLLQFNFS
jgi:uncharacterized protein YmfQ (DUF2313 family)